MGIQSKKHLKGRDGYDQAEAARPPERKKDRLSQDFGESSGLNLRVEDNRTELRAPRA
jgi:hypothetical protein